MSDAHADVSKHVRSYIAVFVALAICTVLTVAAANQEFGGSWNIVVALSIAAVKASLVAAIFMHLKWERALWIWVPLAFCAAFFVVLMLLPVLTAQDLPPQVRMGTWG